MTSAANGFNYESPVVPDGALFIEADEPLLVYPSVAAAQRHLEAVDVENGVYRAAYGPHGEIYRVGSNRGHVIIERTDEADNLKELRALLLRYLEAIGHVAEPTAPVSDLVAEVWAIESNFWRTHDSHGERFGSRMPLWGCAAFALVSAAILYLAFD